MFVFYDRDSDFDPKIKIFWDENVLDYVHFAMWWIHKVGQNN